VKSALNPSTLQVPEHTLHYLWRSYRYLAPYWKTIVPAYACTMGITALNIAIPQFLRWIIDRGIRQQDMPVLVWAALGLLVLTLLRGGLTFLEGRWSEVASQGVAYDLRGDIQRKLTILSFSFHDQTETGDLLARAMQDVERIRFLTGRATLRMFEAVLLMLGTSLTLIWMNARLALLVLVFMPFLVLAAFEFGRRYRPLSVQIQKQVGVLTTMVEQNLRGAQVVKAFAQGDAESERFAQVNQRWFELSAYAARLQAFNLPLLFLLANLGTALIVWFGGRAVIQGELSLGEMIAFSTYLGQLVDPIRRLGMIIPAVIIAASAGERIFEVLDSVSEVTDVPGARPLPAIQGQVRFEGVSFSYATGASDGRPHGKRQVLSEIDFEARPGQLVALVGPTGSGKTSVVNLIPRFYDPTHGSITIDGHDIRQYTLLSLRSQIGIVLQETVLFSGTIRENLLFGYHPHRRPETEKITIPVPGGDPLAAGQAPAGNEPAGSEAHERELAMIAAARAAQAHDFIQAMPDGYNTRVGERGVTLSGGQKQRLAIARAMLMDPRILILDDATASVDSTTEHLIQQALAGLIQGRTTFVIAHRLSTVMRADLILVLDKGRIVARGRHAGLLHSSPLYADIYQHQLRPQARPGSPPGAGLEEGAAA